MQTYSLAVTEFSPNAAVLYVIAAIIIIYVLAQSVFFLIRAIKQGKQLGMKPEVLKRTARRAAIFAIAPAIAIFIGVAALAPKLGIPLPWFRLSVIGSLVYETAAAKAGADAFGGSITWDTLTLTNLTAQQYVTIAFIMCIGCLLPLVCVTLFTKKYSSGMLKMEGKDKKWGEILTSALFMGVVSCFFAVNFCKVTSGLQGWIPIFVMMISAAVMLLFGVLQKVTKWHWINDYALPVSMVIGMICSVPIYNAIV